MQAAQLCTIRMQHVLTLYPVAERLRRPTKGNIWTRRPKPKGNFIGFSNRYKQQGDKRPNFDGRIAIPGTEREFRMALWAGQDKHGNVMFSGRASDISTSDSALEQIGAMAGVGSDAKTLEENGIKLEPGQIVVFKNGFKDEANPNRPDFYGRWNPGTGDKLVNVSGLGAQQQDQAGDAHRSDAVRAGWQGPRRSGKQVPMSTILPATRPISPRVGAWWSRRLTGSCSRKERLFAC